MAKPPPIESTPSAPTGRAGKTTFDPTPDSYSDPTVGGIIRPGTDGGMVSFGRKSDSSIQIRLKSFGAIDGTSAGSTPAVDGVRGHAKRLADTTSAEDLGKLARAVEEARALKQAQPGIRPHTPEDMRAALEYFRPVQDKLEDEHYGSYVTIDVDDGRMAIGNSATDAVIHFKKLYGESHTFTFHIGSTR